MWSIGCVLSDIVNQLDNSDSHYERTIYPGTSCFPLSPYPTEDGSDEAVIDSNDQLFKILEHKKHTMDDFSFIENEHALQYLVKMNKSINVKEQTNKQFLSELIQHMLEFDPTKRWTAS